jgi:hypothetical protein
MTRRVRKRLQPTLGDYLAIAVGPILIGLLVGSMVFFLIEVFYQGQFAGRLQFIMAWFVVGAVGISRISIEDGREQAVLFAVPLGILVAIAAWRFVEFSGPLRALSPFLSIGLVGLIWWSTDCLTWDCTVIDDDDEAETSGGLLETAGLDTSGGGAVEGQPDAVTASEMPRQSLWERFVEYRRRPHAPGVWVLYFSLAALPLFGLGQLFLPAENEAVRRRAFLLLVVYVASGLGLLLVTSFVNLRRYLRQRRLTMPVTMAATWVVSGTVLIAGILLVCLVLAGRGVGYTVADVPVVASIREGLTTSRWAMQGEGREEAEGTQLQQRDDAQRLRDGNAQNEVATAEAEPDPAGKSAGADQIVERRPTATQAQADDSTVADGAEKPPPNDSRDQAASGREDTVSDQATDQRSQGQQAANDQAAGEAEQTAQADGGRSRPSESNGSSGEPSSESPTPPQLPEMSWSGDWLKLIGWILLVVVLAVAVWWYRSAIGAAVRGLLEAIAAFWERLFGGAAKEAQKANAAPAAAGHRLRTFAEFADPFANGQAEMVSTEELIRYSFEAFEAWSGERGFRRRPQQTAHEFADVVGQRLPAMERDVRHLAELVSWAAFSGAPVPRSGVKPLARLWQRMQTPADLADSRR